MTGQHSASDKPETGFRQLTLFAEKAFAVAALFIFSRALIFIEFSDAHASDPTGKQLAHGGTDVIGQPRLFWLYLSIYAITGALTVRHWRSIIRIFWGEKFILMLLMLAALSFFWSTAPMESLAKSVAMAGCTLFGFYLAWRYDRALQLQLIGLALSLVVIASFATVLLFPETGIMQGIHQGIWRGAFPHKNMLGTTAALAGIVLFLSASAVSHRAHIYWCTFGLALLLLLLSCSKSAMLSFCVVLLILACILWLKDKRQICALALISVLIAAGSLLLQYKYKIYPPIVLADLAVAVTEETKGSVLSSLADILGETQSNAPQSADFATGQGRLKLWVLSAVEAQQRIWLGYGLGGFWRGPIGPSGNVWNTIGWKPPSSHNGLLDLWLHLGLLGVALFLCSLFKAANKTVRPTLTGPFIPYNMLAPILLIYVILANIGESDLFSSNYILWICYVTAVFSIYLHQSEIDRRETTAASANKVAAG